MYSVHYVQTLEEACAGAVDSAACAKAFEAAERVAALAPGN